jgi:hypothetical protein
VVSSVCSTFDKTLIKQTNKTKKKASQNSVKKQVITALKNEECMVLCLSSFIPKVQDISSLLSIE